MIKIQNDVLDPWAISKTNSQIPAQTIQFHKWNLTVNWSNKSITVECEPLGIGFYKSYSLIWLPQSPPAWRGKPIQGHAPHPYRGPWYAVGWWGRSQTDYDSALSHFGLGSLIRLDWATPQHYLHWRGTHKQYRDLYLTRRK